MDKLEMREAEVEALRGYYKKSKQAISELEDTLKLLQKDRKMPISVGNAINNLLELNNE